MASGAPTTSTFPIGAAVGITIGAMSIMIFAVLACLFFYKRKSTRSDPLLFDKRNFSDIDHLGNGLAIGKPDLAFRERVHMLAGGDIVEVEGGRNRPLNEMA